MVCWASHGLSGKESACQAGDAGFSSLGREDPLEKEMATHSSIFAWRIPRTEEPGRFPVSKVARVGHNLATKPPDMVPVVMYCLWQLGHKEG